jgi:hypothetical protein
VSAEIVGPFKERRLVVNGWQVPFLEATELDGGRVHFTLDHRLGLEVDAKDFERIASFLANAIAVALGLPSHPSGEKTLEETQQMWALLPHPALAPRRLKEITDMSTEPLDDEETE